MSSAEKEPVLGSMVASKQQEKQWREEFEIYLNLPVHRTQKHYTNLNDYVDLVIQARWDDYLAACEKRQEEMMERSKEAIEALDKIFHATHPFALSNTERVFLDLQLDIILEALQGDL